MKSIHAISTILADWRIDSSAHAVPCRPFQPAVTSATRPKGSYQGEAKRTFGRVHSQEPHVGIPTLLADALLQGGSSTGPRRK
jgi:hypothetical protein